MLIRLRCTCSRRPSGCCTRRTTLPRTLGSAAAPQDTADRRLRRHCASRHMPRNQWPRRSGPAQRCTRCSSHRPRCTSPLHMARIHQVRRSPAARASSSRSASMTPSSGWSSLCRCVPLMHCTAVRRPDAELHHVRLLPRQDNTHTTHRACAELTRWAHVALPVAARRRPTSVARDALQAHRARPAAARLGRTSSGHCSRCSSVLSALGCWPDEHSVAHTVRPRRPLRAHRTRRVRQVRLLPVRTRRALDAVRRVFPYRTPVCLRVHAWIADAALARSPNLTRRARRVLCIRLTAIGTHHARPPGQACASHSTRPSTTRSAHARHDTPATEKCPAAHTSQAVRSPFGCIPALHSSHTPPVPAVADGTPHTPSAATRCSPARHLNTG